MQPAKLDRKISVSLREEGVDLSPRVIFIGWVHAVSLREEGVDLSC